MSRFCNKSTKTCKLFALADFALPWTRSFCQILLRRDCYQYGCVAPLSQFFTFITDNQRKSHLPLKWLSFRLYTSMVSAIGRDPTTASPKRCPISSRQNFSTFHKYQAVMDIPEGVFRGKVDRFNGITVESKEEYGANTNFPEKLKQSLAYWIDVKRRAIWFKIQTEHSDWIPILTKNEFQFHHAKEGFLVMYRWLPISESLNIPAYAHTMVGVGGLVVDDKDNVLVVSDRYAMIPGSWKLPGGYLEPNENIIDAAIREVLEETGVQCTFDTIISIRHTHQVGFDCSDIYVVVGLKPKNLNLHLCDREILKCEWMPITKFLDHPNVHETNRHFMRTYLNYRNQGARIICQNGLHQVLKKEYSLYFIEPSTKNKEN